MFIVLCTLSILFLRKCLYWYTTFMINDIKTFKPKVDKPRVFMFSIFLPTMGIVFYLFKNYNGFSWNNRFIHLNKLFDLLYLSSVSALFATFSILLFFTLTQKFELVFLPKLKEKVRKLNRDFKSDMKHERVALIFDRLIKLGFMEYEDYKEQIESKDTFVRIFVQGKLPEQVCFTLAMDNIQTYCFYKLLNKEIEGFELNHLLQIFGNKNRKASAKSIIETIRKAQTNEAKDKNKIELIFAEK